MYHSANLPRNNSSSTSGRTSKCPTNPAKSSTVPRLRNGVTKALPRPESTVRLPESPRDISPSCAWTTLIFRCSWKGLAIIYPVPKWVLYRVILDLLFVGSSRFYYDWVSAVGLFVQPCFAFAACGQRMFLLYLEPMSNAFRSSILNAFPGGRRVGMWVRWGPLASVDA